MTVSLPPGDGVFFVGTATVLLRLGGFTILTDPNFLHAGEQVHLGYGLRSTRRTNPAIEIEDLPPLDLIVLSHLHEDHFDRVAEQRLDHGTPVVTTPHAAAGLRRKGFLSVRGLRTWQRHTGTKDDWTIHISALPARHGPDPFHRLMPATMGSLLEVTDASGRAGPTIYISGDTLVHETLREIPRRYPGIDLGLLHLGGTRIFGVLLNADGREGVELLRMVASATGIPIHYDDYTVFKSPLSDFQQKVRTAGLEARVVYLQPGVWHALPAPSGAVPQPGSIAI